jgi:hypothetical protein
MLYITRLEAQQVLSALREVQEGYVDPSDLDEVVEIMEGVLLAEDTPLESILQ